MRFRYRSIEIHGGGNLTTLVGGLGLGYTAAELIRQEKVSKVVVIDYLRQVIDWLADGLVPLSDELNAATNLRIVHGDIYQRLMTKPSEKFDLIVIDVDHSPSDQLGAEENAFYTEEGLAKAKLHLTDGGVLAVWSYAESSSFADALRATFGRVLVEPVTTLNTLVGQEQTDWLFFGVR